MGAGVCVNGLFPRHHMRVWRREGVEKGTPGKDWDGGDPPPGSPCSGGSPPAEVTLTPGGHWCSRSSVSKWGQKVLERGRPDRSALKVLLKDAYLCFSLTIIFQYGS